jgi:hypothetical protein
MHKSSAVVGEDGCSSQGDFGSGFTVCSMKKQRDAYTQFQSRDEGAESFHHARDGSDMYFHTPTSGRPVSERKANV